MSARLVSGHVFRRHATHGDVWYAKYRLPDGRQVKGRIGPAWSERGRPADSYYTRRSAQTWLDEVLAQARRRDLAAVIRAACRARARALAAVLGAQALVAKAARARAAARVRAPLSGVRSVRSLGEGAARAPRVPEPWRSGVLAAVAIIEDLDAQITEIDRELKAAGVDHRYIPLLMTVPGIAWVLGYTIRRRDRRRPSLLIAEEALRVHGSVPEGPSVGRDRPPGPAHTCRSQVPALGADGGRHAPLAALLTALPAQQAPPRKAARRQGRPGRHRQAPRGGDLAHAEQQASLRSGRCHAPSGRVTALIEMHRRSDAPIEPGPPASRR